jgi:hypothetical protein
MLKLDVPDNRPPIRGRLSPVVADLRKTMNDKRLKSIVRMQAAERLMHIAGFDVPRHHEAFDALVNELLNLAPVEKPESITVVKVRKGARSQALSEIRDALQRDIEAGRIRTLSDAVAHLRLPEQAPTAPLPEVSIAEVHKDELNRALELIGRM